MLRLAILTFYLLLATSALAEPSPIVLVGKPELVKEGDSAKSYSRGPGIRVKLSGVVQKDFQFTLESTIQKFEDDLGTNLIHQHPPGPHGEIVPSGADQFRIDPESMRQPMPRFDQMTGQMISPPSPTDTGIILFTNSIPAPGAKKLKIKGTLVLDQLGSPNEIRQIVANPVIGQLIQIGPVKLKPLEITAHQAVETDAGSDYISRHGFHIVATLETPKAKQDPGSSSFESMTFIEDTHLDNFSEVSYWELEERGDASERKIPASLIVSLPPNLSGDSIKKIIFSRPTKSFEVRVTSKAPKKVSLPFDLELDLP